MKKKFILSLSATAALLVSCTEKGMEHGFSINGAWTVLRVQDCEGTVRGNPDSSTAWLRIYDDSCYYLCQVSTAPNGTMVDPHSMEDYTFIDKGGNDILYLQGDNTYPLEIVNDSMMVIQERGWKYTWGRCKDISEERCREIVSVIKSDMEGSSATLHRYVFSNMESELETANHTLACVLFIIGAFLLFIVNYAYNLYRDKRRVEQELRLIEQEREARPEPVRQAMDSVEATFHQSDYYVSLRRRIAMGDRLAKDDWEMIETHFKSVYPRFCSTLLSLHTMSQVEYRVCLLLKLRAAPSEIASVLCKEASSISSIRSRLYQKVFGKKGSSKDWDEFILSL